MISSLHLLHVDDDPEDRWLFEESIKALDQDIVLTQFSDGTELLLYLEQLSPRHPTTPYAVISDMQMTLMGGLLLLKTLKQLPAWHHVPFIIFSTSSFKEDITKCLQQGATGFFTKPSTYTENQAVIRQMITLCLQSTRSQPATL